MIHKLHTGTINSMYLCIILWKYPRNFFYIITKRQCVLFQIVLIRYSGHLAFWKRYDCFPLHPKPVHTIKEQSQFCFLENIQFVFIVMPGMTLPNRENITHSNSDIHDMWYWFHANLWSLYLSGHSHLDFLLKIFKFPHFLFVGYMTACKTSR